MNCPKCGKDYQENPDNKGFFTSQNDHFGKDYRTFGYQCSNCGFHSTVFNIPVMVPFKRTRLSYNQVDVIVKEFKTKMEEYLNSKQNSSSQLELFIDDIEEINE